MSSVIASLTNQCRQSGGFCYRNLCLKASTCARTSRHGQHKDSRNPQENKTSDSTIGINTGRNSFEMKLINVLILGILSLGSSVEAGFHSKNERGTRNSPKNIAHNRRRSNPQYAKRGSYNSTAACSGCVSASSAEITAPKINIWNGLTNEEAGEVAQFLFKSPEYSLVPTENATEWNNTLYERESP